ncbi:MAG TPA: M28 family peptidase [Bryobacteraceae bacterium]|nr:M28 family peptidase [Bryobacteraceae bacterium]
MAERKVPTRVEFEVIVETRRDVPIENLVAELPGTNPDEVVIVGAHLDSRHGGTALPITRLEQLLQWKRCGFSKRSSCLDAAPSG